MTLETQPSDYGEIPLKWNIQSLHEVCMENAGIQTGPFGSQLHQSDYQPVGTPIITVEHLGENRITHRDIPLVSDDDLQRLSKYKIKAGDIIFSRVGSVDRRALVRDEEDGWLFSGRCLRVRPDHSKISPAYLSWFFGLPAFKEHIQRIAVGATMPSLNTALLSGVKVIVPPISEQRAIARVLSALDDKIELNRQMNRTLETMAQAIFKSWFVDFDPVVAKAEGRKPYGMSDDVAALFPDKFVDVADDLIPMGWKIVPAGYIATAVGGGTPSTQNPIFWKDGTIEWATPKDLAKLEDKVLLDTERKITDAGLSKISSGLLPAGTVLLSSRAPIGYLAITEIPVAVNQGFIALVCNKGVPNHYVLNWINENMDTIIAHANGTTFLEISKSSFRHIPALLPTIELLNCFSDLIGKFHQQIVINIQQSKTLAAIRDTLLPKLLSGEIRLKQAEQLAEQHL